MCLFTCVCVCVCMCVWVCVWDRERVCVSMCFCVCVVHACVCTCVWGCAFKRMCQLVHVCMPVCVCLPVCACGCRRCLSVHVCARVMVAGAALTKWGSGGEQRRRRSHIISVWPHTKIHFCQSQTPPKPQNKEVWTIPEPPQRTKNAIYPGWYKKGTAGRRILTWLRSELTLFCCGEDQWHCVLWGGSVALMQEASYLRVAVRAILLLLKGETCFIV